MIKYAIKHKEYGYCSIGANWGKEYYVLTFGIENLFLTDDYEVAESALNTMLTVWHTRDDFEIVRVSIEEIEPNE